MPGLTRSDAKLQRWIDLIAALLRYRYPVPFETLQKEVPAYQTTRDGGPKRDSVKRTFERDKDELRALGVPITSSANEDGNVERYLLRPGEFYLPLLSVLDGVHRGPRRPPGYGYQGLPALQLLPDEFALVVRAARRVQALGDPQLADDAAGALRKIGLDVPLPADGSEKIIADADHGDEKTLNVLDGAVRKRKRVTFTYHSIGRNDTGRRSAEPYGLVFVNGAWYLVARDMNANALRQFKVRRMSKCAMNTKAPQTPDFAVPDEFDLSTHAESRLAWELGDADAVDVVVEFSGASGSTVAAMALGTPDGETSSRRRYRVRRVDVFSRWLLSLAGEARPVEPPAVVEAWLDCARRTAELYQGSA